MFEVDEIEREQRGGRWKVKMKGVREELWRME